MGNTAANRLFSFRVRGREGLVRHHALGFVVFVLTLGLTSGALGGAARAGPRTRSGALEVAVLVASSTGGHRHALRGAEGEWVFAGSGPVAAEQVVRVDPLLGHDGRAQG